MEADLVAQVAAAVTGHAEHLPVAVDGPGGQLPARLAVEELAVAGVAGALLAAASLAQARTGVAPTIAVDRAHVAAAVRSERYFRLAEEPAGPGFAPLSRFWPTADGWLRTHANYAWHRRALLDVVGTSDDPAAVAAALADRSAAELEDAVFAAGGVAVRVRSPDEWAASAAGRAVASEPLVGHHRLGEARPRRHTTADLPAGGLRVLDLTRVIAGPVCTRILGALGADVLRLDPPGRPDLPLGTRADTLLGKRSALLDLTGSTGVLHALLDEADVLVIGYRPGALDGFGLDDATLAERHPGLVVVRLAAWGHSGPWQGRRGFDSIVQAASGIAMAESDATGRPGALPCQLLDHGTGYLAAAAALDAVRRQEEQGGTHLRTVSLARTARWLLQTAPGEPAEEEKIEGDVRPWLGPVGPATAVKPPGRLGGRELRWPSALSGYGESPAAW